MAKQLTFKKTSGWGGKRNGSGRTNFTGTVSHMERPEVTLKTPLHITLRLKEKLPNLRRHFLFKEFKTSLKKAKIQGLYVIHFSIQSNHIHLFAESPSNQELALGMRSFAGRFAKIVRRYAHKHISSEKKGSVFKGRYHLHVLRSIRETKNALEYVLLNLSKHQKFIEYIDTFSSGRAFKNWKRLLGNRFRLLIKSDAEFYEHQARADLTEILSPPQSWLASVGWMRAG